jgi:NADH-quinone oxidoreductase subunit J
VVLYLFVVMLVNLQRPPDAVPTRGRQSRAGFALAAVMLAEISAILVFSAARPAPAAASALPATSGVGNTEVVGMLLYSDYLVPFEVASMLLLVAMVGAIILARKEA